MVMSWWRWRTDYQGKGAEEEPLFTLADSQSVVNSRNRESIFESWNFRSRGDTIGGFANKEMKRRRRTKCLSLQFIVLHQVLWLNLNTRHMLEYTTFVGNSHRLNAFSFDLCWILYKLGTVEFPISLWQKVTVGSSSAGRADKTTTKKSCAGDFVIFSSIFNRLPVTRQWRRRNDAMCAELLYTRMQIEGIHQWSGTESSEIKWRIDQFRCFDFVL